MQPTRNFGLFIVGIVGIVGALTACKGVDHRDSQRTLRAPELGRTTYDFVDGDVRYGYHDVEVTQRADGCYVYRVETRMKIDLFGAQKQETQSKATYVVTPELRPVSMSLASEDLSGKATITGSVVDGLLMLDVDRNGEHRSVEIRVDGPQPPLFSVCLADKLAMLPASTKQLTVQQIAEEGSPDELLLTRLTGDKRGWLAETGLGFGDHELLVDANDRLVELRADVPPLVLRRTSERTSTDDLAYRVMTGREVLTFRVDKPIGLLDRVQKLSVKLEWKDPPLAELQLEDARQRLVSHSHTNGQHVALVEVSKPAGETHSDVTLPVTDPALTAYLAETSYVKPLHPAILAAARSALAGETKALPAVHLLSKWVHGHIEGQLVAGTLSGPEVLANKRGKCTEYATLFASLARSVGIPTRMALGERLMGESWVGHMWNEAWVGRWVTVDASVDEVDHSLSLLKFVHSDTVMGTQAARWKLTKSLAISMDDIERMPSHLEQRYQTGLVDGVYTNSDFACRIRTVGKGWLVENKSANGVITLAFRHEKAPSAFYHFVAFAVPEGTKPKAILDARKPIFTKNYTDFELLESKSSQIADSAARMWRFRGKPKTNAKFTNGHTEHVWIRGSRGFLMNMITLDKNSDADRAYLDALLASFEFLK